MKMQTVFNRAAKHLLTQGRRSQAMHETDCGYKTKTCMYRGPNGLKCALGGLISNKYYNATLEAKSILNEDVQQAVVQSLKLSNIDGDLYALLSELQTVHDDVRPSRWQSVLNSLTKKFKLKPFIKAA